MDPIVAYLKDNPEVWMPYLVPPILAGLGWAWKKLDSSGPIGHAMAEVLTGFGLDAAKVKGGLLTLWAIVRKKPLPELKG